MINPDDLVAAWVTALQAIPALTTALGGEENISGFYDRFPGQNNLRRAILDQPPGSILVVYLGTSRVRPSNATNVQFRHAFSFAVRAPEAELGGVSYAYLFSLFVNGIPGFSSLPLLHTQIHDSCYPMDMELPTSQRTQILIGVNGETQDYFELQASLVEIGDNQG